ncbi:MAG: hypothetical protein ACYTGZ_14940 [Planctomycetota bacterium]|jgi:hypothetical protein
MRVLTVAVLATAALAGEPVELKAIWKAKEETSTALTIERKSITDDGKRMAQASLMQTTRIVYGERVDEVKDGRPIRLRRKYAKHETTTKTRFADMDLGTDTKKHELAGTILAFHVKRGELVPKKDVAHDVVLCADWESLLPGKPVKAKDSWTAKSDAFIRITGAAGAKFTCTFDGKKTIQLKVDHALKKRFFAKFKGSMVFEKGKIVRFDLKGKVNIDDGEWKQVAEYAITTRKRHAEKAPAKK